MTRTFNDPGHLLIACDAREDDHCHFEGDALHLDFEDQTPTLVLPPTAVGALVAGALATVKGLQFIPHCGFRWHDHAEVLVTLLGVGGWSDEKPLTFAVGDVGVRAGEASSAIRVLLTPAYWNDFEEFELPTSLQFSDIGEHDLATVVANALFYLNSHYLRAQHTSVAVRHLLTPADLSDLERVYQAPSVQRRRRRTRILHTETVPLELFNAAATEGGEARFLGFYRVLEFYFTRAHEAEVERARQDSRVSTDSLIRLARPRDELSHLQHVLKRVLSPAQASGIVSLANRRGLATGMTLRGVGDAMYAFRNSIVHAKEREVSRSTIPRALDPTSPLLGGWLTVVEELATRAIRSTR